MWDGRFQVVLKYNFKYVLDFLEFFIRLIGMFGKEPVQNSMSRVRWTKTKNHGIILLYYYYLFVSMVKSIHSSLRTESKNNFKMSRQT